MRFATAKLVGDQLILCFLQLRVGDRFVFDCPELGIDRFFDFIDRLAAGDGGVDDVDAGALAKIGLRADILGNLLTVYERLV